MEKIEIEITEEHKGSRIDKALSAVNPEWSRTQIQAWLKDSLVLVGGIQVKPNYKVRLGDIVTVEEPELEELDMVAEELRSRYRL